MKITVHILLACSGITTVTFSQTDSVIKTETGIASYYARAFEGRKCSSGDIFRHDSLTAAHKHLKFGTRVRVINLKNDSVTIVRINDRLPRYSKRTIDLTMKGARKLNFIRQGLTKVRLEILPDSSNIGTKKVEKASSEN